MRFVCKVGIFTCMACFFLMSHNASAANLSYNLNDYSWKTSVNLGTQYCAYAYDTFGTSPSICILTKDRKNMYGIISYALQHKTGDLAQFHIAVQNNIYSADSGFSEQNFGLFIDNFGTIDDNFKIISFEQVDASTTDWANYTDGSYSCTMTYPSASYSTMTCSSSSQNINQYFSVYTKIYKVTILWTTTGSHPIGLRALNSNTPLAKCFIQQGLGNNAAQCQVRLFGYTQWEYKGSSVNKEQSEATQNAADESESEAQENSSNSQTTNLIGAFQSFVTALTSLNATNCNVTLPFPSALGGNMQVNICQNKDYAGNIVSVFGSLTLIVFYIPFSLKLLSMIYNEIRSFTNG